MGDGRHVIAILPEQEEVEELGGTMRLGDYPVALVDGTRVRDLYSAGEIVERHRHRYEVNPVHIPALEEAGVVFSGTCGPRMEVMELPDHPFFLATQFHPEFRSRPARPSPPFIGFVRACRERRQTQQVI